MADVTGAVSRASSVVGRYFGIVSVLPSFLLVAYLALLVHTGAWSGPPDWPTAFTALTHLGLGSVALLVFISFAAGVVLHPLQFAMVQVLEGYWGVGQWTQSVRSVLIERHVRRRRALWQLLGFAQTRAAAAADNHAPIPSDDVIHWRSVGAEADRLVRRYPHEPRLMMPTSLGNMLRRYEVGPGTPFGFNLPATAPLLALVAPPEHMKYVNDQRSSFDLAVRACLVSLCAALATFAFLWDDGLWLLLTLIPYGAVWLLYRGSVIAAEHYGIALATLMMLNRFEVYDRLHLDQPGNLQEELELNTKIRLILEEFETPDHMSFRPGDRPRLWRP